MSVHLTYLTQFRENLNRAKSLEDLIVYQKMLIDNLIAEEKSIAKRVSKALGNPFPPYNEGR